MRRSIFSRAFIPSGIGTPMGSAVLLLGTLAVALAAVPRPAGAQGQKQPIESFAEARIALALGRYAEATAFLERVPRADSMWMDSQVELVRAYTLIS